MFNPVSLYYLNQMGIDPWIVRREPQSLTANSQLFILLPAPVGDKEQILLNKILNYMQIPFHKIQWIYAVDKIQPQQMVKENGVIVSFGVDIACDQQNSFVLSCPDLTYLLNNPKEKKHVFNQLVRLSCV